jgi:hypothetical protein
MALGVFAFGAEILEVASYDRIRRGEGSLEVDR